MVGGARPVRLAIAFVMVGVAFGGALAASGSADRLCRAGRARAAASRTTGGPGWRIRAGRSARVLRDVLLRHPGDRRDGPGRRGGSDRARVGPALRGIERSGARRGLRAGDVHRQPRPSDRRYAMTMVDALPTLPGRVLTKRELRSWVS